MLTKKQLELLTFLKNHLKKNDVPPSFDEMKDALNLKSKSGIHRLVSALEERGFIRRLPNRARAIEIIKTTAIEPSIKSGTETFATKTIFAQRDSRKLPPSNQI